MRSKVLLEHHGQTIFNLHQEPGSIRAFFFGERTADGTDMRKHQE